MFAVALGTAGIAAENPPAKSSSAYAEAKSAFEAAQRQDCRSSASLLGKLIPRADFAGLPEAIQAISYEIGAVCETQLQKPEVGYRYALAGTSLKSASDHLWRIRLALELKDKRNAPAVDTIEAMAIQKPEALNAIPIRWLYRLNRDLKKDSKNSAPRLRMLATLSGPFYQPVEVASGDDFKFEYAGLLIDGGDKAGAVALFKQIQSPDILLRASVDPRLRDNFSSDFDGRSAVEQELARSREVAASHASSLAAVLKVAAHLRHLGRAEESLATLEAARPDGPQATSFTDLDEHRNWWWDAMARSYQMLGRYDDAVIAFRRGIDAKEYGALNVSQTLNLGYGHLLFGHPTEALAVISDFGAGGTHASPYGLMMMTMVRGCARLELGQKDAAKQDLAYVGEHERDNPGSAVELLLCANDLDGAAKALIRQLDDSDQRVTALLMLSDYDPPPPAQPNPRFQARLHLLKERPDLQAAVKRAGGTRHFRVQAGES